MKCAFPGPQRLRSTNVRPMLIVGLLVCHTPRREGRYGTSYRRWVQLYREEPTAKCAYSFWQDCQIGRKDAKSYFCQPLAP